MKPQILTRLQNHILLSIVLSLALITVSHADTNKNENTPDDITWTPAMGFFVKPEEQTPLSELKYRNPKLSSSLNQLVNAYESGGRTRMESFAKKRSMKLRDELIWVVIEIDSDRHQPLPEEIIEDLQNRIIQVGGEFELGFNNLMQVWLPVSVLDDVSDWSEVKIIREPFRPQVPKHSPSNPDQTKSHPTKALPQLKIAKASENGIASGCRQVGPQRQNNCTLNKM